MRALPLLVVLTSAPLLPAAEEPVIALPDAFPPPGKTRFIAGELTFADHVNRMGVLRPDRSDRYEKAQMDLPHRFVLPPYGSVWRCGAAAELRDVPLGTHLHGWFHLGPHGHYEIKLAVSHYMAQTTNRPNDRSPESMFSRAIRLEDDFTFYQKQGALWEMVSFDEESSKLTLRRVDAPQRETPPRPAGYPDAPGLEGEQVFEFDDSARIWIGRGLGTLADVTPGRRTLFNLTWASLYGPGRITDLWLDAESRELARAMQRRTHRRHLEERGLPVLIESVEHLSRPGEGRVTCHLVEGLEQDMLDLFQEGASCALIVVEPTLRSFGQASDYKSVRCESLTREPAPPPGSSGLRVRFHINELLEGVRPGRTVRLMAPGWTVRNPPAEENLWPFDLRQPFLDDANEVK